MHVYTHARTHAHTLIHTHTHTHAHSYTCMHAHTYTHTHTINLDPRFSDILGRYARTYSHTHTHTHTHTLTHSCTHSFCEVHNYSVHIFPSLPPGTPASAGRSLSTVRTSTWWVGRPWTSWTSCYATTTERGSLPRRPWSTPTSVRDSTVHWFLEISMQKVPETEKNDPAGI